MLSTLVANSLLAGTQSALRQFRSGTRGNDVVATLGGTTVLVCHKTLWIAHPRGLLVRCESGTLWLVFDGDPEDVVLEPGEALICRKDAKLSIHAMTAARVRLV